MKRLLQRAWIVVAFIAIPLHSTSAQSLKALLISSASPTKNHSSYSASHDSEMSFFTTSSFRNDPLIVIEDENNQNEDNSLKNKLFSIKNAWELFDSREMALPDTEAYKNQSSLEVFYNSLDEELHADPFYHVGRDTSVGEFIYEEQVLDAVADTLRKKSKIFRAIDDAVAQAEDMVTLKYETASQIVLRAKPGIEQVGGKRYPLLRLGLRLRRYKTDVDTRISEQGIKLRVGKKLNNSDRPSTLSLEHESTKRDDDEAEHSWEQKSQVCLKVPIW